MKNQTLHRDKGFCAGSVRDFAGKPEHKSLAADRLRAESPDKVSSRHAAVSHETCEQCDDGTVYNDCTCGARDTFDDPAEANCVCTNLEPVECEECDGSGEVPVEDPKQSLVDAIITALEDPTLGSEGGYYRDHHEVGESTFFICVTKSRRGLHININTRNSNANDLFLIAEMVKDAESIARINAKAVTA